MFVDNPTFVFERDVTMLTVDELEKGLKEQPHVQSDLPSIAEAAMEYQRELKRKRGDSVGSKP